MKIKLFIIAISFLIQGVPLEARLVDRDGDGKIDEDRQLSSYGEAGFVYLGEKTQLGVSSAFVVGRRHIVTAAHAFLEKEREGMVGQPRSWWMSGSPRKPTDSEFGEYWVFVEGCERRYQVKRVNLHPMSKIQGNAHLDFAVVELTMPLCDQVDIPAVGAPEPEFLNRNLVIATGYYRSRDLLVSHPEINANVKKEEDHFQQYSSSGRNVIFASIRVRRTQRVDAYRLGQSFGGSGGPIFVEFNGKRVIFGMQYRNGSIEDNGNFSISISDEFVNYLREHVPDLNEWHNE